VDQPPVTLRSLLQRQDRPSLELTLAEALQTAAENSRDFQDRKEQLYFAALALTRQRWEFSTRFDGGNVTSAAGVADDTADGRTTSDLSARRVLATGGLIVASFVNTFVRSFTSGQGWDGSSILSLTLTQPLLRGFGRRVTLEPLTQAERTVVYEVRSFERFRRELAVSVVSAYYDLLTQMDAVDNAKANIERVAFTRARNEELQIAGRMTGIQVDQAVQSYYRATDRSIRAVSQFETQLDRFKLTLGLPPTISLQLDRSELDRLRAMGVTPVELEEDQALRLALTRRLDLRNTVDQVEDSRRRIVVAEDALRMGLDFSAGVDVPTEPDKPLKFDWDNVQWNAGIALDLGLERLPERNAYRTALISLQAQIRRLEEHEDQIKQSVRQSLRRMKESLEAFKIQVNARLVAERRVESAQMALEAGLASAQTRDILEAQDSLITAQNSETSALVDHVITKLELFRDLEALTLGPAGLLYDPSLTIPEAVGIEKR
jgi:outer membrane protein TolC